MINTLSYRSGKSYHRVLVHYCLATSSYTYKIRKLDGDLDMAFNFSSGGGGQPITRADARTNSIYGDQAVRFSDNGRLVYPGQPVPGRDRPTNMLLWRGGAGPSASGPIPANNPNFRYRPWSRTVAVSPVASAMTAPIITRRIERVSAGNGGELANELTYASGLPIAGGRPMTTPGESKPIKTTMAPETVVIEEMRIYDEKPCGWWLFLIIGILMIGVGVANIIICFDYHVFCYLWTGVALVIFGVLCAIHKGDYFEKKWKSWLVIIAGYAATVLIFASFYLVTVSFCHQAIEISQFLPTEYIRVQIYRYGFFNLSPLTTVNNDWTYNIWICFALDAFSLLLLLLSLGVLTTTLLVADKFYNSHYMINRKVEPFCEPWLFNPWSQSSLGQAMIIIGCLIGSSEYGVATNTMSWFIQYSTVWAGTVPIIAGPFAALALKNCGGSYQNRSLSVFAVIVELVSLIASIIAVILTVQLLSDNISSLNSAVVMNITSYSVNLIIASSILEALVIIISVVNIFFSLSLLFRILACLCTKMYQTDGSDDLKNILYEEDNGMIADKVVAVNETKTAADPVLRSSTEPAIPRFDPYRPMGLRSFYYP